MKKLIMALFCISSIANAKVDSVNVRPILNTQASVLMIHSEKPLIITKDQQAQLDQEMGQKERNQLYTEFVMQSSPSILKTKYQSAKRPATAKLIQHYQDILASANQPAAKSTSKVGSL